MIWVNQTKDYENIAATSSKKLKQVHEFLEQCKVDEPKVWGKLEILGEMMNA